MANACGMIAAGPEEDVGKILQPINSYTRFPISFHWDHVETVCLHFDRGMESKSWTLAAQSALDSTFAYHCDVEIHLDRHRPTQR